MPKLKIWDKNLRKEVEDREIDPSTVHSITRYSIRGPSGPIDGCAMFLKDAKGAPGIKLRSASNYNNTCRDFGITAEGHNAKAAAAAATRDVTNVSPSAIKT